MKHALVVLISLCCGSSFAQTAVLFLGNSYTAYNNLPQLTADLAASAGFQMTVGSNTPGGFSFNGHSANATSQQLIGQGTWDYVVLQEQSQIPSFPISQVESDCFPFAELLNNQILGANPCAETVFYMTWGRENGDSQNCANWPPVCTYEGMDDLLYERYMQMAVDNDAIVSPVGRVWRFLRENAPEIELYAGDGSHPSAAGSYVAACCMFSVILEEDPMLISDDFTLSTEVAQTIRNAVHQVVYSEFEEWFVGTYHPLPSFSYQEGENYSVTFTSTSTNADGASFEWDFGFATGSSDEVTVQFPSPGNYEVTMTVISECDSVSVTQTVVVGSNNLNEFRTSSVLIYPNPSNGRIYLSKPTGMAGLSVRVTDSTGRVVLDTQDNSLFLESGVYFIDGHKVIVID